MMSYPATTWRPLKNEVQGQGAITLSKILGNAIKMKATYNGGLLRY